MLQGIPGIVRYVIVRILADMTIFSTPKLASGALPDYHLRGSINDNRDMVDKRLQIGHQGEQIAANYLVSQSYDLLDTNWHCDFGELDLVMRKQDIIIFVEVKTRRSTEATPLIAITPRKRERLIAAAHHYLAQHQLEDMTWRIDAVAVILHKNAKPLIEHVEDALDW